MSDCQVSLGRSDSKRIQLERGRFWGWAMTKPRRRSIRWMVESAGTGAPVWLRCQAMVRAPASRPSSARRLRQATILSSSTAEVRLAGTLGPRRWGTRASSPPLSVEGDVALYPGLGPPGGRRHRPHGAPLDEHGIDAVLGQIHGTASERVSQNCRHIVSQELWNLRPSPPPTSRRSGVYRATVTSGDKADSVTASVQEYSATSAVTTTWY